MKFVVFGLCLATGMLGWNSVRCQDRLGWYSETLDALDKSIIKVLRRGQKKSMSFNGEDTLGVIYDFSMQFRYGS